MLVESPINPRAFLNIPPDVWRSYEANMRTFADENAVEYWNVNNQLELADEQFTDWTHIRDTNTRHSYSAALAGRVGRSLVSQP